MQFMARKTPFGGGFPALPNVVHLTDLRRNTLHFASQKHVFCDAKPSHRITHRPLVRSENSIQLFRAQLATSKINPEVCKIPVFRTGFALLNFLSVLKLSVESKTWE